MEYTNILTWKEVSKDYVKNLNNDTIQVLIYNPFTNRYSIECAGKKCIVNSKHAEPTLKYYVLVEGY